MPYFILGVGRNKSFLNYSGVIRGGKMLKRKQKDDRITQIRLILSLVGMLTLPVIIIMLSKIETVRAKSDDLNSAIAKYPHIKATMIYRS